MAMAAANMGEKAEKLLYNPQHTAQVPTNDLGSLGKGSITYIFKAEK